MSLPQNKIAKIPSNVLCHVFSFMDFKLLLNKVSRISKDIREILITSENLNQERVIILKLDQNNKILNVDTFKSFDYGLKLATKFEIELMEYNISNGYLLQLMMKKELH